MQKKSNLWLIVIAIIVLLALLWPVLRREKTPIDTTALDEETATTSEDIILNLNDDGSLTPAGLLSDSNDETTSTSPINQISSQTPTSLPLKISFGNQTRNPKTWQCNTTYAVTRTVPATSAVARAALGELLKGPSPADASAGFFTSINQGVTIKQLTINGGVAQVDLSQPLIPAGAAACLKDGARAQITETLKQFPTVKSVIISVNGVLF